MTARPLRMSAARAHLAVAAFLALTQAPAVTAATLIADQQNTLQVTLAGFTTQQVIGQSFVPVLPSMNAVELLINDQSPGFGGPVDTFVNIRSGTIGGLILGASQTVAFPDLALPSLPQVTQFLFSAPIALVPGSTYWIEFVAPDTSQSNLGVFASAFNLDAYPAGTAFADTFTPDLAPVDLWFRQGTVAVVPVPAALPMAVSGLMLMGACARRRTRREC
jgi:hypothetical protein